jgi:signal transduction histidine kinase
MELRAAMQSGGLAWAALGLLDKPSSPTDLARKFQAEGAVVDPDRTSELLTELADLGLARIAEVTESERRWVRSPLGDQMVAGGITEGGELTVRLAELERLRSDLFTTVAHELRTPLTAIRTAVGLLLDPDTRAAPAQRHQLLKTVERNAEQLQRLADSALELARFRAGHLRLQLRRFDARELGEEIQLAMGPLLDEKRQRLILALDPQPVWVFADHRRVERAVLNLVSNAHKFSPADAQIRLEVKGLADEVVWEVSDTGPGIAPAEQTRLFERFFVSAPDGSTGGSGLGLPIVLASVQAHGGRVEVDSELGRGSTFRLIMPAGGPKGHDS